MKTFVRVLALLLAALTAFGCLAACHGKGAVVATFTADGKTYTVTSGQYAFMLVLADNEARTKVSEELTDAEKNAGSEIDYYSRTLDDKDFVTWVEDRAEELMREYFYVASSFDKNGLELSESDVTSKDSYLAYLWSMSGYGYVCEPNGVSYDSFATVETVMIYQRNALFKYLYGPDGPTPVTDEEKTAALQERFAIADVITMDPSTLKEETEETEETEQTEEEKEAEEAALKEQARTQLQGYADRINGGVDFSVIYYEFTGTAPSEETEQTEEASEESKPEDTLATLYGDEDTSVSNALFAKVKECEIGKAAVVETDDGKLALVLRKDITADPYYAEDLDDEILSLLKGDAFTDLVKEDGAKLDLSIDSFERDHIRVKNIDYSVYNDYINALYSQYGY